MIKFSPYISIYDLNQKFESQNEVIWTFSKNLKGISNQRQRLNIHLVDEKAEERKWLDGSIKSIWKYFDQSNFLKGDLTSKKKLMLKLIRDSFLDIYKDLNWDTKQINEAYDKTIAENIEFSYRTKLKFNKSRTKKGLIEIDLIGEKVIIWGVILDNKKSVLIRKQMIETFPHQVDWFKTFKNFKWLSDKEFGFEFSQGITLSISEFEDKINWKHKSSEEELGFIRSITYRSFKNEKERTEWMNK